MLETILIVALSTLSGILAILLISRYRRERGAVLIREDAVNDLIASMAVNTADNSIQNVAGSVSNILQQHLACNKIIFLKYYRSNLELNFFTGVKGFDRNVFKINLSNMIQKKLRNFKSVAPISELNTILSDDYINRIAGFGLKYFFPVFLRENLYGLYFIRTSLLPGESSLNLLTTALAFNLSTAYHINTQDQKIKKITNKINSTKKQEKKTKRSDALTDTHFDMLKLLGVRTCQKLIPEMLKMLKKECNFSRLGFYLENNTSDDPFVSVSWNIDPKVNKLFNENCKDILKKVGDNDIVFLGDPRILDKNLGNSIKKFKDTRTSHLMSIKWTNNKRALLVFGDQDKSDELVARLKRFESEALPLLDNINRFEKAEELSYTDGLTGMYNFRYFKKRILEEFQRAKRYDRNLALLIFDVDDLKVINDKFGHLAGDALIKLFGKTLTDSVRTNDVVSRYGGDEFCLIMPDTSHEEAIRFMERISALIAHDNKDFNWANKKLNYSVSIGGAVYPADASAIEKLIDAADMALLRAKAEGRNCYKIYQPEYDRKE